MVLLICNPLSRFITSSSSSGGHRLGLHRPSPSLHQSLEGSLIGRNGETFTGRRGSGCPPLLSTHLTRDQCRDVPLTGGPCGSEYSPEPTPALSVIAPSRTASTLWRLDADALRRCPATRQCLVSITDRSPSWAGNASLATAERIGTENLVLSSRAAATGRETSNDALRGLLLLDVDEQPAFASLGLGSLKSRYQFG
jgi:hypothetical protein